MVFFARYWAATLGSETIDTEHVVRGLLEEDSGFVKRFMGKSSAFESMIDKFARNAPRPEKLARTHPIPLSDESKRILQRAAAEADGLGREIIAIGHFGLALIGDSSPATSVLTGVLKESGLSLTRARERVVEMIHEELP